MSGDRPLSRLGVSGTKARKTLRKICIYSLFVGSLLWSGAPQEAAEWVRSGLGLVHGKEGLAT